jgi:exodeoxyribonuclease V alpha subunit
VTLLEQLEVLCRQQHFNDLDLHFVRLMVRLAGDSTPELVLGASLASHWTGNGHVCIDLNELADRPVLEERDDSPRAPELTRWLSVLQTCPVVGRPGDYRPLVLDGQGRLYLYRYWDYERRLAEDLLARVTIVDPVNENRLRRDLQTLFPASDHSGPDWQKLAAVVAVLKRFCVISGGPGTGKTTTVIRMLVLVLGQAGRPLRIRLAAPTGKAAARMQEAIRLTKQQLDLEPALREAIPEEAFTLHRLLGAQPDSVYFRHHRDNPLALDVLVVDEASMVDLALMTKLIQALPAHARFILLGDRDQLASVEAGAVLGDICGSPGFSEPFRDRLQALTGEQIPAAEVPGFPLQDSIVLLQHSYRFGPASGIGRLARLVNRGQGSAALELLESGRFTDILWYSLSSFKALREGIGRRVESGFRPYLEQVRAGSAPAEILATFNRFRVLCALRTGPAGVQTLNRLIEDILQDRRLINARSLWYPGRPVMITRNDYNLRLFNGDVGIALEDPQSNGRLRVFFQAADGSLRGFPPRRLPEHQTVYAMTIHKSQGSEFDQVLMVLPFEDSRIMTRELVYTGITRARSRLEIWGEATAFKAAVARRIRRSSGLRDRLWAMPPGSLND